MFNLTKKIKDEDLENKSDYLSKSLLTLEYVRQINISLSVFLVLIGIIGNCLIIYVYSQSRFRKNSNNVYLLLLSINNSFYLIVHFFEDTIRSYIYLDNLKRLEFLDSLNLLDQSDLACSLFNYIRYVLRSASAYIMIAFTLQNLLIVYLPLSSFFKSTKSAWIISGLIEFFSLMFNSWFLAIFRLKLEDENKSRYYCDVLKEYDKQYFKATIVYIFVIMLVPILVIFMSNFLIVIKITRLSSNKTEEIEIVEEKELKNDVLPRYSKDITKDLILISLFYAIFNLPYFVNWCCFYYYEKLDSFPNEARQNYLYSALKVSELFYLLNYSVNFYIYAPSSSVFFSQLKNSSILNLF